MMSNSTTRFTGTLWNGSQDLLEAIDGLEFLELLGGGTLSPNDFQFYMHQDTLYLRDYAKALAFLAARCPDSALAAGWAQSSAVAGIEETQLHQTVLPNGPDLLPAGDLEPSPVCLGYTTYLLAQTSTAPYPVGAAAVLPCFWVYADVAKRLAHRANGILAENPEHPYAKWVAAYDDAEFQDGVEEARARVDAAAEEASPALRAEMLTAFRTATRYEYLFWDSAQHRRPWPVGRAGAR
ncbi:MAG: TenA family protein [Microbacteriaceae bacterium]|nr:TenA family protein [Microbacteriaceae bacterium]